MAFHDILIESDVVLKVSKNQLVVISDGQEHIIPSEEIDAVLIESEKSVITSAALSMLAKRGACLFICDEKHTPNAALLPYMSHSRQSYIVQLQLEASQPLKKRLWQSIVKTKIENQAICLDFFGAADKADRLRSLARSVHSGDTGNAEAVAAALYFPALFGTGFTRGEDCFINSALNYGYAILRGAVARSIVVHGLLPLFGIHHDNDLNAYNLADDLMEPFRPMVDAMTAAITEKPPEIAPAHKRYLFTVLNMEMSLDNRRFALRTAMEEMVESYVRSLQKKKEDDLKVPKLLYPEQHHYE